MRQLIFFLATLLICNTFAKEEMYSAVEELLTLTENDEVVIREMRKLITDIEEGVKLTKKYYFFNYKQSCKNKIIKLYFRQLHKIEVENVLMLKDVQKYIENPLNSLLLIKRLSYDLEEMNSMFSSIIESFNKKVELFKLPLSEFHGALSGLNRLMETYKLESSDLARGIIEDKKYRNDLAVSDLMGIGKAMMKLDKSVATEYLKLARQKNDVSNEVPNIVLLDELFQSYKSNEKYMEAAEINNELLKINPNSEETEAERLHLEMLALFDQSKDFANKVRLF